MFEPVFPLLSLTEKTGLRLPILYTNLIGFRYVLYEDCMFEPVFSLTLTDREDRTEITYLVY